MRRFIGIATGLALASGAAVAAASLAPGVNEPQVWTGRGPGDPVIADVVVSDDEQDGPMRRLAVLGGRGAQLGVSIRDLDIEQQKTVNGAVVEEVQTGSAAEKAGIKKGDVIAEFDGERVRGARHLSRLVGETPEGRTVKAAVMREGKRLDVSVTPDSGTRAAARDFEVVVPPMRFEKMPRVELGPEARRELERSLPRWKGEFKRDALEGFGLIAPGKGRLGVGIQDLSPQLAEYFGTSSGVLVATVDPESPAGKAGLKAGDVITAVNGKAVNEPSELIEIVGGADDGGSVTIDYTRDKKAGSAKVTLEPREKPRKRQILRPV